MAYLSLIYTFIFLFLSCPFILFNVYTSSVGRFLFFCDTMSMATTSFFFFLFTCIRRSLFSIDIHIDIIASTHPKIQTFGTIIDIFYKLIFLLFFIYIPIPSCCIVLASSLSDCTNLDLFCHLCISFIFTFAFLIHLVYGPYDVKTSHGAAALARSLGGRHPYCRAMMI